MILVLALGANTADNFLARIEYARPIDQPRDALSASFGEFRYTHLHAGIDFATFGVTGLPVRAIDDGTIYRVRSAPGGYGNVVYIDHKNLRSVYAHLERFAPKIRDLLPRPVHRLGGDWSGNDMEAWPSRKIEVKKGEVIAWSGESGAGKPHLHFELRDLDDRPRNPVRYGILSVQDERAPEILGVVFEPADVASSVDGGGWPIEVTNKDGGAVLVDGRVKVLLRAFDEDGLGGGRFGLTRIELFLDGKLWSVIDMHQFSYGRHREVGEVYDYYRTGFGPTTYAYDLTAKDGAAEVVKSRGPIEIEGGIGELRIVAVDLAGNVAERKINIVKNELSGLGGPVRDESGKIPLPDSAEWISQGGLVIRRDGNEKRLTVPATGKVWGVDYRVASSLEPGPAAQLAAGSGKITGAPKETRIFSAVHTSLLTPKWAVGPAVLIGPYGMPLPSRASVMLKNDGRANGIAMYRYGDWRWMGGGRSDEFLYAELPYLAPVVLVNDDVPPIIEVEVIQNGRVLFRFSDDFSGVDGGSIRIGRQVNSEHVPVEGRYDPDHKTFEPHDAFVRGTHILIAEANDAAGNAAKLRRKIVVK